MKILTICGLSAALVLSACSISKGKAPDADYDMIEKTAIQALSTVQQRSYTEKVEYCGWVIEKDEEIRATEIIRGNFDSCELPQPPKGSVILASFHTHGNHTPDYSSEFPSVIDVQGDFETDVFGFVATPGGRVWVVDPFEETISQACGPGCVPVDPTYNEEDYAYIPERFTREMIYGYYGKGKAALH